MLRCPDSDGKAPIGGRETCEENMEISLGILRGSDQGATACNEAGIDAYFPIVRSMVSLEDAMKKKKCTGEFVYRYGRANFPCIKALK